MPLSRVRRGMANLAVARKLVEGSYALIGPLLPAEPSTQPHAKGT